MLNRIALTFALLAAAISHTANSQTLPVEAFAQLPQYDQPRLSPDGRSFSYLFPINGRAHLVVQPTQPEPGEEPWLLAPSEDADFSWYAWSSSDRLVVSFRFEAQARGANTVETRLMAVNRDGSNPRYLVRADAGGRLGAHVTRNEHRYSRSQIQDRVIDFLPEDEHQIMLAVDDDQDNASEVRIIDLRDGSYRKVHRGHSGVQNWLADRNGDVRYGWGRRARSASHTAVYRTPEDEWVRVEDRRWFERGFRPIAFTGDPRIVYALGPASGDRIGVVLLDLVSGTVQEVLFSHEHYDVTDVVRDPVTHRVIGAAWQGERPGIHYFHRDWRSLQASIDHVFPDTTNRILSLTPDRNIVLVKTSSDRDPGALWVWDRANRRMDPMAVQQEDIDPDTMAPMLPVQYEARDGTEIPAYLTRPVATAQEPSTPGPAVLLPHGGPHARDHWEFSYWVQFLANRGYTVLQPNFRGSAGYGSFYRDAGEGQWGGLMQDDLTDAARWLVEEGLADPDRICIVGGSYGGYAALMGAVKTPDQFACAASINGVSDLVQLIHENQNFIGGRSWNDSIGLDGENRRRVSPHHRVREIDIPVLLVHAEDDARVPFDHAEDMERRLRRAGKDVTLVALEEGGHALDTETSRVSMLAALETFLGEHIGAP